MTYHKQVFWKAVTEERPYKDEKIVSFQKREQLPIIEILQKNEMNNEINLLYIILENKSISELMKMIFKPSNYSSQRHIIYLLLHRGTR